MKNKLRLVSAVAALSLAAPALAHADDASLGKGTLLITGRVTDVWSDASNDITASGAPTGLHVHIGSSVMPTLGFTYFLTDHISAEAILGATDHQINAVGSLGGTPVNVAVKNTWVLPPVITLQYRPLAKGPISPYVGAGVNAMVFFAGENKNGYRVGLSDAVGWAVQGGFDAPVNGKWTINADVKKVFVTTKASVDGGALISHVNLSPWVVSVGVGRKFF